MKYEPLDFFMIRTPLLSVNNLTNLINVSSTKDELQKQKGSLIHKSNIPEIKESLAVSSLSLIQTLNKKDKTQKQEDQVTNSLFKYINRMCMRPTPFGLFSGVTVGNFGEKTDIKIDSKKNHLKRARPDMQWLLKLLKNIESEKHISEQLYVTTNKISYKVGNRLKIPFMSNYGDVSEKNNFESSSIQWNEIIDFIMNKCYEPIKLDVLNNELYTLYPQVPLDKIKEFTIELLYNEFLISTLRPPFIDSDPFTYILQKLEKVKGIDPLLEKLHYINNLIHKYNQMPVGEGLELYTKICSIMQEIESVKNPLQIDMRISTTSSQLHYKIKKDIKELSHVLWELSSSTPWFKHLNEYHEKFLERYGVGREISILELLDEDIGLGAPPTYENPTSIYSYNENNQESILLSNKLMVLLEEAISKGEYIKLTDEIIDNLKLNHSNDHLEFPDSMEIYCTVKSNDSSDEGDYQLVVSSHGGSPAAGKTFGRFLDILEDDTFNNLRINEKNQKNDNDFIYAEVVYLPRQSRVGNVSLTKNLHDYQIVLGTTPSEYAKSLELDDLVVGCTMNRLYIKSLKLNKEIIPTTNHMLNFTNNTPNIYRFLCEMGLARFKNWRGFHWGLLSDAPYLPRVTYKNSILSLATWNISQSIIRYSKNQSDELWIQEIQKWCEHYNVPQFVYLTEADNRILFNLQNRFDLLQLRNEFIKLHEGNVLTVTEVDIDFESSLASDDSGNNYNMEVVFPLKLRKDTKDKIENSIQLYPKSPQELHELNRVYLPGSEWLYIKMYGCGSREEELLGYHLSEFIKQEKSLGSFDQYFFMRYADPEQHIRLRFKGDSGKLLSDLLPKFNSWAMNLKNIGILSKFSIDTYNPEIERYGGPELLSLAERVFYHDSELISKWIYLNRFGKSEFSLETLGIINVIDYASHFIEDFQKQLDWFNTVTSYKNYGKEFREKRSLYMKVGNNDNDWYSLKSYDGGEELYHSLKKRSKYIKEYVNKMKSTNPIFNHTDNIMGSFIHLSLNRLIGIDRHYEEKIMTMSRHTLHNLRVIKQKKGLQINVEI
ncbi:lantibiotic dehydratase [Priestia aryabhattai]|uniref:lantibiotic dehydratase n=1 Tax=Priestia aryabhattai TaxID=412384 RepID=UPI001CFE144A|nr:lantibiotic dehydratase [Priestia aryabhattai]